MFKELFTSEKSKLRFELISNILKNSNGKFLLGDKVSSFPPYFIQKLTIHMGQSIQERTK